MSAAEDDTEAGAAARIVSEAELAAGMKLEVVVVVGSGMGVGQTAGFEVDSVVVKVIEAVEVAGAGYLES